MHGRVADLPTQRDAETGIKMRIASPAPGPLIEKTLQNLEDARSSFELVGYLGVLTTQQVGRGYWARLDVSAQRPIDWTIAAAVGS